MSVMGSFMLFAIFIVVYIIIVEIFTVLFRMTGLTREKARTQVISMLTNSGFTTTESELILSSRRRRKLAQITMLFGYSFTAIIVSIFINMVLALNKTEITHMLFAVISAACILIVLLLFMRLKVVEAGFDRIIERLGNRFMFGKGSNPVVLIDIYKDKAMVEIQLVNIPEMLKNVPLAQSQLSGHYDIHILFIKRKGETVDKINGDTMVYAHDTVFMFGDYKNIRAVFEHPDVAGAK